MSDSDERNETVEPEEFTTTQLEEEYMPDHDYSKDKQLRDGLTELLQEHGYAIEGFGLSDKPVEGDEQRTLTLKATRSLKYEQQRIDLRS